MPLYCNHSSLHLDLILNTNPLSHPPLKSPHNNQTEAHSRVVRKISGLKPLAGPKMKRTRTILPEKFRLPRRQCAKAPPVRSLRIRCLPRKGQSPRTLVKAIRPQPLVKEWIGLWKIRSLPCSSKEVVTKKCRSLLSPMMRCRASWTMRSHSGTWSKDIGQRMR